METENTETRPLPRLHKAAEWMVRQGESAALTIYWTHANATTSRLTTAELQAIVQQAYDMFGMVATPCLAREAARTPAEVLVDEQDGWPDTLQLLQQRVARA